MIESNDWRLEAGPIGPHKERFMNIPVYQIDFVPLSEEQDHVHCAFCWEKFGQHDAFLHRGYCTTPQNSRFSYWVCPECFSDFKDLFNWRIENLTL